GVVAVRVDDEIRAGDAREDGCHVRVQLDDRGVGNRLTRDIVQRRDVRLWSILRVDQDEPGSLRVRHGDVERYRTRETPRRNPATTRESKIPRRALRHRRRTVRAGETVSPRVDDSAGSDRREGEWTRWSALHDLRRHPADSRLQGLR